MIKAANFGVRFHGQVIFEGVNFEVPAGQSWVIIGPSGAGKSLFLKALVGLLPDSAVLEGELQIESKSVGMLFQKNALFDSLSVEENLLFPMRERLGITEQEARKRAHQWLESVGLVHAALLLPHEISGGMQKRLGIARALCVEPEVVLYDEPTAGLDPITSRKIAQLILDLRKSRGMTLITVTNEVSRAYQLADQIVLLANGSLVLGGSPAEVQKSKNPALRQFVTGGQKGPLTASEAEPLV